MTIVKALTVAANLRFGRSCRFARCLAILAVVVSISGSHTFAENHPQTFCNGVRLQDEITLINTRSICSCCDPEALRNEIRVENYAVCDESGARRWQPSDLQSFLAFDPTVPTVIYVHGNQISPGDAKNEGVAVYRRIDSARCRRAPHSIRNLFLALVADQRTTARCWREGRSHRPLGL